LHPRSRREIIRQKRPKGKLATEPDETPHRIPEVTTTPATTADVAMLPVIQAKRATRQLTPGEQIVGFFAQPLEKVYFRNTPLEWSGELFLTYLIFQNFSECVRIESRDMT
jgi:hypothetical protein